MSEADVPRYPGLTSGLRAVYTDVSAAEQRYKRIAAAFQQHHSLPAVVYARAPGRVNVIGEHIDYAGLGVLPIALEQDVVVAAATTAVVDGGENEAAAVTQHSRPWGLQLVLGNTHDQVYPRACLHLGWDGSVDEAERAAAQHTWFNYLFGIASAVLRAFPTSWPNTERLRLHATVDGSVPPAAGLSSSSALSCAFATAMCAVLPAPRIRKLELAEIARQGERFVGVLGGGMDQTCSMTAQRGTAMYVTFKPDGTVLDAQPQPLPDGSVFVVASTGVKAEKQRAAAQAYNTRVVEQRIAALLLVHAHDPAVKAAAAVSPADLTTALMQVATLSDAMQRLVPISAGVAGLREQLRGMEALVRTTLRQAPYSRDDLATILGAGVADAVFAAAGIQDKVWRSCNEYAVYQRSLHVFTEAARVLDFINSAGDAAACGALMNDSHASCRDLYACSCDELDALTALASTHGALGSRLTGAGWGGCTVSLVASSDEAHRFVAAMKRDHKHLVFPTSPGCGAAIIDAS